MAVDRLLERLERHGLRLQVTLFAEADRMMPDSDRRRAFAEAWAARAARTPERFVLLEVANEHWQNGIESVSELRALGRRLGEGTTTLVALSSPAPGAICDVYAGSGADVATIHYGRSSDRWAGVREPWVWPDAEVPCREALPVLINNEPMGPQSSVAADEDPVRLAMSYVTTFLAGNAAYVLHAGAGVRGGGTADRALGRASDFASTPNLEQTLSAIAAVRSDLPTDLPNWRRQEPGQPGHPLRDTGAVRAGGSAPSTHAATSGDRFVIAVLDARDGFEGRATRPLSVQACDPLTGAVLANEELEAGATFQVPGRTALLLIGTMR